MPAKYFRISHFLVSFIYCYPMSEKPYYLQYYMMYS